MKRINIKLSIFLMVAATVLLGSCRKGFSDFGDLNNDPNAVTSPVTSALLTSAQASIGGYTQNGGFGWGNQLNIAGGLYAQYFAETQYTDQSRYAFPTINWDVYYAGTTDAGGNAILGPLYDLQSIININSNSETSGQAANFGSNNNQIAIARILMAYVYMQLTDAYGDIPVTAALKGESVVTYDKQEDIYPALLSQLKAAAAQFDNGTPVQGDIVYSGNVARWKRLANSIRAVMALRMSKANPTLGRTEFNDALTAGVIQDNADNFAIRYPGGNFTNPIYAYYNITRRFDYATSKTVTDKLQQLNDPRINVFASSTIGVPYGLSRDEATAFTTANPNWSQVMAPEYRTETSPIYLLTAGNMYLVRAEAALLGWTSENVANLYNLGVTASLSQWGIGQGAITAYLVQTGVALTPGNELKQIAEQRWLSHFPEGMSGWSLWRRTGFPQLSPAPGTSAIPRRIPYGPNEQLYNPTNYQSAASKYSAGGVANSQFARVWWDKP
jgi:hypothetical protein